MMLLSVRKETVGVLRRKFSRRERIALFLASGGRCARCGVALDRGWHADHMQPFARGGLTDVINGQALCPSCNIKKGADMTISDRWWQMECLAAWKAAQQQDFLCEACPGAGKTRLAQLVALDAISRREVDFLIVVVPTTSLREQTAQAFFDQAGMQLSPYFAAADGRPNAAYAGIVVTYQAIAESPQFFRRLSSERPTLVVLDEIHHAGDGLAWGRALRTAFENANLRLALSGTPFRSDSETIPFVRYLHGKSHPDYRYGYDKARKDRICASVTFPSADGDFEWFGRAGSMRATFADALPDHIASERLRTALDIRGDWMKAALQRADSRLTEIREGGEGVDPMPNAGGLVTCKSIEAADEVASYLQSLTGEQPVKVNSELIDAADRIKRFRKDRSRWLVSVKMVSEGVDVPRLKVGVYATNIITEMYFRQFVGRFVRGAGEAVVFVPADGALLQYAAGIADERDHALKEEVESILNATAPTRTNPYIFGEASYEEHVTIRNGIELAPDLMQQARSEIERKFGVATEHLVTLFADVMQDNGWRVGQPTSSTARPVKPAFAEITVLRGKRVELVNGFGRLIESCSGLDVSVKEIRRKINNRLIQAYGLTVEQATPEVLDRQLRLLSSWLNALLTARNNGNAREWLSNWEDGLYDDEAGITA